jgi:hypothetical protein
MPTNLTRLSHNQGRRSRSGPLARTASIKIVRNNDETDRLAPPPYPLIGQPVALPQPPPEEGAVSRGKQGACSPSPSASRAKPQTELPLRRFQHWSGPHSRCCCPTREQQRSRRSPALSRRTSRGTVARTGRASASRRWGSHSESERSFSTTAPFDLCGAHNDGGPPGQEEPLPAGSPLDD